MVQTNVVTSNINVGIVVCIGGCTPNSRMSTLTGRKRFERIAKESAYMERWYNTLRQWLACFSRKTLAFSKSDTYHEFGSC